MLGRPLRAGFRAATLGGRGPIRTGRLVGNVRIAINGQSNANGLGPRSQLATSPLSADPGLAAFDAAAFERVKIWVSGSGSYESLQNGVNQQAWTSNDIGPEFGIAVRWMREVTTGVLYIDKSTASGSAISTWRDGQANFEAAQTMNTAATAWLSSNGVDVSLTGWVWVQGESDNSQTQTYYYDQLVALHSERVAAGMSLPLERKVIAQMAAGTTHYSSNVVAAKSQFVNETLYAYETTCLAFMNVDNLHYNARGQLQIGYDAFEKILGTTHLEA